MKHNLRPQSMAVQGLELASQVRRGTVDLERGLVAIVLFPIHDTIGYLHMHLPQRLYLDLITVIEDIRVTALLTCDLFFAEASRPITRPD